MSPPRNPSELERLEQERRYWKNAIKHNIGSKSTKEYMLRELRKVEEALGIESKPYNSNEF
jgi:hypothetical protein